MILGWGRRKVWIDRRDLRGYAATAVAVACIVALLGLLLWASAHRRSSGAPGFPPGWRCDNLGDPGAEVCVREKQPAPASNAGEERSSDNFKTPRS